MAAGATADPSTYRRRSFVYRKLVALGARFGEIQGAAVALDFGDAAAEARTARRLGLADLSPLPRAGFKGRGAPEWLGGQGIAVPETSNRAAVQPDGTLVARLSPSEVLVLAAPLGEGTVPERLGRAWHDEPLPPPSPRGYPVPRAESHAWFLVSGEQAPAMFAKLCGVDLRPRAFPAGQVAQTSLARLSGIVIRADLGALPAFHVLADSAAAAYLWDCLVDAMAEFEGTPVGIGALRAAALG